MATPIRMKKDGIARAMEDMRPDLLRYLTRFIIRADLAEELVQETALRALQNVERAPERSGELRPWMFRIATNLAIDARRKQSFRREDLMETLRGEALSNEDFYGRAQSQIGQPEMRAVAKEHLTFCFHCTAHNLSEEQAATLLLKEFHGMSNREVADVVSIKPDQVKNRLQEGRATMNAYYGKTCALVTQEGVCHQCKELDAYYEAGEGNPLADTRGDMDARLAIVRRSDPTQPTRWQKMLLELVEDLDGAESARSGR